MDLVLCMAGLYKRFREAGYRTPKFLLPWNGGTILGTILDTMLADGAIRRVTLVANRRDAEWREALEAILAQHGIGGERLLYIGDTRGQAETAAIAARHLAGGGGGQPVLFHNIDTVLLGRDYHAIARRLTGGADGWIDVFDSDSPNYSYVTIDPDGRVTAMAEKIVISRHATSGLYGFASPEVYLDGVEAAEADGSRPAGEFYISDVYRAMIAGGARIEAAPGTQDQQTIILGTPAEYEALAPGGAR